MKTLSLLTVAIISFQALAAQNSLISWGADIQLKRQTKEITLIAADNTGTYFQEELVPFTIGLKAGVKIRKYDNAFKEIFTEDLSKDLNGMVFKQFLTIKDKIFIIAYIPEKKDNQYIVFGAEINKTNGALNSRWKELASVFKELRSTSYEFTFIPSGDSSSVVLVANTGKTDQASYKLVVTDNQLTVKSTTEIQLPFVKKIYELIDVLYTSDNKFFITGKIYEMVKERNKEKLSFKQLAVEKYDISGKKEYTITNFPADRFMLSAKVLTNKKGDVFICGSFSTNVKTKRLAGISVNRINADNGNIISVSEREISRELTGTFIDDPEDRNKLKVTDYNIEETDVTFGYLGTYRFKEVYINSDNSILLIAEKFKVEYYTKTYYNGHTSSSFTIQRFTSGDLMATKIGSDGSIQSLYVIPKMQIEETTLDSSQPSSSDFFYSYANSAGYPKYSSFTTFRYQNNLLFYYNDQPQNSNITKPRSTLTAVSNLYKSNCYELNLNLENGNVTKKLIFTNQKQSVALLRNSKVTGNELFFIAFKVANIGKSEIKIGKISLK